MTFCIPVVADRGMSSRVSAHFGSAPLFLLVDHAAGTWRAVPNQRWHPADGACQPLAALSGEGVQAVIVGGIGSGALDKLLQAGLQVYHSKHATVADTLAALDAGGLETVSPGASCVHPGGRHGRGHHQHDDGCQH